MSTDRADSVLPVAGVRLAAVAAGIRKPDRLDLVVMELAEGSRSAAVFTRNRFAAAPVEVAREHLAGAMPRYLLINTGSANAGTGEAGLQDCRETCALLAEGTGTEAERVLPFSTGVIGERFAVDRFAEALPAALERLDEGNWEEAGRGILTTDTVPKLASRRIPVDGREITVTGMAKGSGMIRPDMATMLAFVTTDAPVANALLQQWARELSDASFNRITVDGDTSTNDACVLTATGRSGHEEIADRDTPAAHALFAALKEVFVELAQAIVRDGEGATRFVEIRVEEAASEEDARAVADTIAHSPLVKTALFAGDPNWGRILAAVGRAPVPALDISRVDIRLNDVRIVHQGQPDPDYTEDRGAAACAGEEILIGVTLGQGDASSHVWTCDFSYDYVRINAEYRT